MKKIFSSITTILIIAISNAQISYQIINNQPVNKTINRIAYDNSGNTILTGHFGTTISFGSFNLNNNIPNSTTTSAPFVVKMLPNGSYSFAKAINLVVTGNNSSSFMAHINSLCTDGSGNIILVGSYRGKIIFDNTTLTSTKSGADYSEDIFITKMSPAGSFLWARSIGAALDAGCIHDVAYSVTVDNAGNIYTAGELVYKQYKNTGGCPQCVASLNSASAGAYIVKHSPTGTKLWENNYINTLATGSPCEGSPSVTNILSNGTDIYVAGQFFGTVNFGGASLNTTSNSIVNVFLLKLNGSGSTVWARSPNENGSNNYIFNSREGLFVYNNELYIAGTFFGSFSFGSCTPLTASPSGAFIVKFSSLGDCQWPRKPGGSASGFATYPNGNLAAWLRHDPTYEIKQLSTSDGSTVDSVTAVNDPNASYYHQQEGLITVPDGFVFSENLRANYELGGTPITYSGNGNLDLILVKYTALAPPSASPGNLMSESSLNKIVLYPNPASSQLTILNNNNKALGNVTIYEMSGKMIYKNFVGNSQTTIDIKKFSSGFYYLRSDQLQATLKFVKQ